MSQNPIFKLLELDCHQSLSIADEKSIPYFSFKGNTYIAKPCNVYDGDTFSAIFSFNGEIIKYRCRCIGYDTAEMKPHVADKSDEKQVNDAKEEKNLALLAKNRFQELVTAHPTKLCIIKCYDFDKYGRLLVKVYNGVDSMSINDIMIKEGHGKVYDGGTKEKWTV